MKRLLTFFFLLAMSGCAIKPQPVNQFNVEAYTRPYQTEFGGVLTIVLDNSIPDNFEVSDNFRPMPVYNFRNSLRLSLYYTFADSFDEVQFAEAPADEGVTIHLFRIRPFWKVHQISEDVSGYADVVVTDQIIFLSSLIRYDGMIYRDGKKSAVLDEEVIGERVETNVRQWNKAFEDGIREMCEDLYRHLAQTENPNIVTQSSNQ